MKNKIRGLLLLALLLSPIVKGQNSKDKQIIEKSLKENLEAWKNSPEILAIATSNPKMIPFIDAISAEQLNNYTSKDMTSFISLFSEEMQNINYEIIIKFLGDSGIGAIENAYWRIIESPDNKVIGDLLLKHMNRYKESLETEIKKLPSPKQ